VNNTPIAEDPVVVGGMTPLTTIDYPGELAAVIFLQGCPWRCGYCQNSELLPGKSINPVPWLEVISLLEKRKGLLDAVVFSGGEPTMQSGLPAAILQVKSMGYKIGLHTAGIYPQRLQRLLPLLDWVGMDIKSGKNDYQSITGVKGAGERAWRSAEMLIASNVEHEFRTTVHPDMLSHQQISTLINELLDAGAERYVIQECVTRHCLDKSRRSVSAAKLDIRQLRQIGASIPDFSVRSIS
jgi:pyruvate formate lyase activating enzyme